MSYYKSQEQIQSDCRINFKNFNSKFIQTFLQETFPTHSAYLSDDTYIMNKCEHNQPITKFCMSQHCQSKQNGGCQDCFKKYHNHIGQISVLTEQNLKNIVKKFQIDHNFRPRSRALQQSLFNFFTGFKNVISANLDSICKSMINQIGYPYLHNAGVLSCYKRLKNKQYRKVTQKQLKELQEIYKQMSEQDLLKNEKKLYGQAVGKMQQQMGLVQRKMKQLFDILEPLSSKANVSHYDRTLYLKITQNFKQIKKYPDVNFPTSSPQKTVMYSGISENKEANPKDKLNFQPEKKLNRDVSLDKQFKSQNKKNKFQIHPEQKNSPINKKTGDFQTPKRQKQQQLIDKKLQKQSFEKQQKKVQLGLEHSQSKKLRRSPKLSFELKADEILLIPNKNLQTDNKYSEKQQQINERKKKLMDLMNTKPITKPTQKKDTTKQQLIFMKTNADKEHKKASYQSLNTNTPLRGNNEQKKIKENSPQNFLINRQFSTPTSDNNNFNDYISNKYPKSKGTDLTQSGRLDRTKGSSPFSINTPIIPISSAKRSKTSNQEDQSLSQQQEPRNYHKRNQTVTSSETETQPLFNAKIHIPIQQNKNDEDFQIKQQSIHKCIVIPQINMNQIKGDYDRSRDDECQSPILIKRKQIQNFSTMMKLAESKIIEQEQERSKQLGNSSNKQKNSNELSNKHSKQSNESGTMEQKSFMRINKILEQSDAKSHYQSEAPNASDRKQNQSVEISESQQNSIALLLHALKKPGPEAIKLLEKALGYSQNNLSAAQYLSYLYLEANRPQDCLKLCQQILKLISSSESNVLSMKLNINKSAALNHLGRYSECITFLERCLRHRHNDILYKNLADAYYSIGILQKAVYNYQHSILENSSNTQAYYNLAVCHYQQENYHNASIYIDKALKHQSNNPIYIQMQKYVEEKILSNN